MLIEVISGWKIPVGTIANVIKIYYYRIPNTNMQIKRCILDGYGSTDWKNVKVISDN